MDYSYSTQPHAAPLPQPGGKRAKFRDEAEAGGDGNGISGLMADPRVMRGSTYVAKDGGGKNVSSSTNTSKHGPGAPGKSNAAAAKGGNNKTHKEGRKKWTESRASTPPPLPGRAHTALMTDEFVEVYFICLYEP